MNIHQVNDLLADALQSDLEHGVKWLNETAAAKFYREYPNLAAAIATISNAEYHEDGRGLDK